MAASLYLLVGPIASGKSTYCREAAAEGAIIVNDDALVTALHGGDYTLYNKTLKPLYKSVENTIVCSALTLGRRVIIDRPNHSRSSRMRYISLAKSLDVPVTVVVFKRDDPQVHGIRRWQHDSRGHSVEYWINVAASHDDRYDLPDQDAEQFDELVMWDFKQ